MCHLLISGLILDDVNTLLEDMRRSDVSTLVFMIFFAWVVFGAFNVLNLLIGLQCEVASRMVARSRTKEEVQYLKHRLVSLLEGYDREEDQRLCRDDFLLLLSDPELEACLDEFGTDMG